MIAFLLSPLGRLVAVGLVAAAAGFSCAWTLQGWRLEAVRGEYALRDIRAQGEATKAIQAAQNRARVAEQRSAQDVAAVSAQYEENKAHVAAHTRKTIADLHTGVLSLRVQLDTRGAVPGDRSPAAQAGPGASKCDGAAGSGLSQPVTATLSAADSEFLIGEASRADEVVAQLTACQAVVRADRLP